MFKKSTPRDVPQRPKAQRPKAQRPKWHDILQKLRNMFCGLGLMVSLSACDLNIAATSPTSPSQEAEIARLRADLQSAPQDPVRLFRLGTAYHEAGHLFEAAEYLKQAADHGATQVEVPAKLALIYNQLGYLRSTIEQLQRCFQLNPQQPDCIYVSGRLLEEDGSAPALTQARSAWLRFLAIAPEDPRAAEVQSRVEQLNSKLGTAALPAEPAAERPAPPPGHPPIAEQPAPPPGHPPIAEQPAPPPGHPTDMSQDVGALNPFGAALKEAINARQRGDLAKAEAQYRQALALRPDDPLPLAGLAQMLFAQGKNEEAQTHVEKAFAIDAKDPEVRWAYGLIMLKTGKNTQKAREAWESLLVDEPAYAKELQLEARLQEY